MIKIKSLDKQKYFQEYYLKNRKKILDKAKVKPKEKPNKVIITKKKVVLYFD